MNRREFLRTAGGATAVASAVAATGASAAQEGGNQTTGGNQTGGNQTGGNQTGGNQTGGGAGGGGGGPTKTVEVGPNGNLVFKPETVFIPPGGTVKWVWKSDTHNIVVESQPEAAKWEGTGGPPSKTYDSGHKYKHTFKKKGTYAYFCQPHKSAGMAGKVVVNESGQKPGAGGGGEVDPEHMGVPFQAHFVGIATVLMVLVSLVFTFFTLKYGESRHASGGNN